MKTSKEIDDLFQIYQKAYERGLRRGLELAKEHARVTGCFSFCCSSVEFKAVEKAIEEETKQ